MQQVYLSIEVSFSGGIQTFPFEDSVSYKIEMSVQIWRECMQHKFISIFEKVGETA